MSITQGELHELDCNCKQCKTDRELLTKVHEDMTTTTPVDSDAPKDTTK